MNSNERQIITDIKKCGFEEIVAFFNQKSEEMKNMSKETKLVCTIIYMLWFAVVTISRYLLTASKFWNVLISFVRSLALNCMRYICIFSVETNFARIE